jgi:hypothetical protein
MIIMVTSLMHLQSWQKGLALDSNNNDDQPETIGRQTVF